MPVLSGSTQSAENRLTDEVRAKFAPSAAPTPAPSAADGAPDGDGYKAIVYFFMEVVSRDRGIE